jgi:hypothetical protein
VKNYAQFNIIIVNFIRIVIIFIKNNTFYFTYPPRKHDFRHILPYCFLFIAESGKYHPVVALLHNHEWLKKISKKVSSSLETVQCILSSILCPSIFREIWRHCNCAPLLCPFRLQYPEVIHCRIVPIEKLKTLVIFERRKPPNTTVLSEFKRSNLKVTRKFVKTPRDRGGGGEYFQESFVRPHRNLTKYTIYIY